MTKLIEQKIEELFENTKDLMSFEEMEPFCVDFNNWLASLNLKVAYQGKKLSECGLYKRFKSLTLIQDKNAILQPKHNQDGSIKGYELKHYVLTVVGLTPEQWMQRNKKTIVLERLEGGSEIKPLTYLQITSRLLKSDNPYEIAVGLIAATGRRPHEILARAEFELIEGKPNHILFKGQGKKKGAESNFFEIPTLFPAEYILNRFQKMRNDDSIQTFLAEVFTEYPNSVTKQNISIDKRRTNTLIRIVVATFGGVLPVRVGEDRNTCKTLRAAYAVLATERECNKGLGEKIKHASQILGHFVAEGATDRTLTAIATTISYLDYYCSEKVPYIEVDDSDYETLPSLKKERKAEKTVEKVKQLVEKSCSIPTFAEMSNGELWNSRKSGASTEKILRSFNSICAWNASKTNNDERLAVTNALLRDLSGCNGVLISEWLKNNYPSVIGENTKYGFQNSKDGNRLETYANKRLDSSTYRYLVSRLKSLLISL